MVEGFISLKELVDNHMQKGELSKYRKIFTSTVMVAIAIPRHTRYINVVFTRVDVVNKGNIMWGYKVKREQLDEIKKIYKFNFKVGINTKTMEKPNPSATTFYEANIEAVHNAHSDLVAITSSIND